MKCFGFSWLVIFFFFGTICRFLAQTGLVSIENQMRDLDLVPNERTSHLNKKSKWLFFLIITLQSSTLSRLEEKKKASLRGHTYNSWHEKQRPKTFNPLRSFKISDRCSEERLKRAILTEQVVRFSLTLAILFLLVFGFLWLDETKAWATWELKQELHVSSMLWWFQFLNLCFI